MSSLFTRKNLFHGFVSLTCSTLLISVKYAASAAMYEWGCWLTSASSGDESIDFFGEPPKAPTAEWALDPKRDAKDEGGVGSGVGSSVEALDVVGGGEAAWEGASCFLRDEEDADVAWKEKPAWPGLMREGLVGGLRTPVNFELDSEPKRLKALRKERRREGGAARMVDW
jgi:hypothetical protein